MARIDTAGKDNKQETIISYKKESDSTYTKVTKRIVRDLKTGIVSSSRLKPEEEGPFILVAAGSEFDEKMAFLDIDGSENFMYFKKVTPEVSSPDDET